MNSRCSGTVVPIFNYRSRASGAVYEVVGLKVVGPGKCIHPGDHALDELPRRKQRGISYRTASLMRCGTTTAPRGGEYDPE